MRAGQRRPPTLIGTFADPARVPEQEATSRLLYLDPTLVERYPEVPWHQIRAIGNVLRHGYDDLDFLIVWQAVTGGNLSDLMRIAHEELER